MRIPMNKLARRAFSFVGLLCLIVAYPAQGQIKDGELKLYLHVFDSLNGYELSSSIVTIYNTRDAIVFHDTLRTNPITFERDDRVLIQVQKNGYNLARFKLTQPFDTCIHINIKLYPIIINNRSLPIFYFRKGTAIPEDTAQFRKLIYALAEHLKSDTAFHISLEGFSYKEGLFQNRLAQQRSFLVYSHLVQYGAPPDNIHLLPPSNAPYEEIDDYKLFPKGTILNKHFISTLDDTQKQAALKLNRRVETHIYRIQTN